jgi:hypothetical protein
MERYVAFLDILGFGSIVEHHPLSEILDTLSIVYSKTEEVRRVGARARSDGTFPITEQTNLFPFSDTFVLSSFDATETSFVNIVASTSLMARYLFGCRLPVRGAITKGEADLIPHTNHLIGKAVIRAKNLEETQDWFGIIIDPELQFNNSINYFLNSPALKPVIVEYLVPFKNGEKSCKIINWRFNWKVQNGTKSIFTPTSKEKDKIKIQNTLKFCKWIRDNNLHVPTSEVWFPWLKELKFNNSKDSWLNHGDEY